jgi:predicted NBD/HSP70 family sugar kinase
VGTGTGGGVVVDRKVLTGPNAIAGEWGHNPLPWPDLDPDAGEWPGPPCYCGKTGCVETFLSGTGLARDYRQATGEAAEGPEIVARAERGEAAAESALARYEARMAKALAVVLNILDPDVVVLGGGMSQVARLYTTVPRLWQQWSFSDRVDTRLRPPVHGDSSGVRGAAWLWGPGEG